MIYHLTSVDNWQVAQEQGEYEAESLAREGFIHASTLQQVIAVANAFYRSVPDLLLLCIDGDRLIAEIRWEDPAPPSPSLRIDENEKFPHIYGAINLGAVQEVIPLLRDAQGNFILPDDVATESVV
jgi:uncharacterized protein (DUF952 family)